MENKLHKLHVIYLVWISFIWNRNELQTELFPLSAQLFPSFQSFQRPFMECKHSVQHYGNGKVLQIKRIFNVTFCKKPESLNSNDHMTYLVYSSIVAVAAFHNPQCKCFRAGGEVYLRDFRLFLYIFHFRSRKFYNGKSICNTNIIKHSVPSMTGSVVFFAVRVENILQ